MCEHRAELARIGAQTYWLAAATRSRPAPRARAPIVRLLPNYDEYMIAFRDHAPVFDARFSGKLGGREGFFASHVVLSNGRVVSNPLATTIRFANATRSDGQYELAGLHYINLRFGREFKLQGYTLRTNDKSIPLSAMVVASYLHTQKPQNPPPTPGRSERCDTR